MSDKQNVIIAEWMGYIPWVSERGEYLHVSFQKPGDRPPWEKYRDAERERQKYSMIAWNKISRNMHVQDNPPKFDTLDKMASAEALIPERALWMPYVLILCEVCNCYFCGSYFDHFALATATAAQRATALVRMIEAEAPR